MCYSPDPMMWVGVCGVPDYIVKKYSMVWLRKLEREILKEMTLCSNEKNFPPLLEPVLDFLQINFN